MMQFFKLNFILLVILYCIGCNNLQKKTQFNFHKGDLIFQDLSGDSISEAIESVTGGRKKLNFSHIGIVDIDSSGNIFVLEAISKGVLYNTLESFLSRSNKIAAGRLKPDFAPRINEALEYGKSLLNSPYDDVYVIGDSCYYCSELIYEMFANSGDFTEIFQLQPMTFKNQDTGEFLPFWIDYYQKLGVDIPEGKPGLNPNGIYQSVHIDIVYPYGEYSGTKL